MSAVAAKKAGKKIRLVSLRTGKGAHMQTFVLFSFVTALRWGLKPEILTQYALAFTLPDHTTLDSGSRCDGPPCLLTICRN